ncbi:MAG: DNA-deoxyinosine glycosylase [Muribaculum sp.]|nr:DNA-deoxyinosine glycosylase [Muribaculum sp.]
MKISDCKLEYEHIEHGFGPVYDEHSEILVLGSLPSVKSREQQFYYGHPQNRFWRVLAALCQEKPPVSIPEKRAFLLRNRIALWDVIASCDIIGSSDSSIRNVLPNDLGTVLERSPVRRICLNGGKAWELFQKYCAADCRERGIADVWKLPSTSPANAAWSVERLTEAWAAGIPDRRREDNTGHGQSNKRPSEESNGKPSERPNEESNRKPNERSNEKPNDTDHRRI